MYIAIEHRKILNCTKGKTDMHLTGLFEDRDGCVFFGRGRGAEVLGPVTESLYLHFSVCFN